MGFVYLLKDSGSENIFKIGVTRGKIEKRIKQLQTGNSEDICLIDYYETNYPFFIERNFHNIYDSKNVKNEWFLLTTEDVDKFKEMCINYEKIAESLEDNIFAKKYLK